jgi:phospholipid/cholesterol/gamma-HCH transport system ATP-binding protein
MITIKDLCKNFDDKVVLKNINAEFHPGQTNMIIGGSGSGKTVLMKCIVGLLKPTSGSINYDDRDYVSLNFIQQKKNKDFKRNFIKRNTLEKKEF